jgi:hypothetical protein
VKVFYFFRANPRNLSGWSCKVWKIERVGRRVTVYWGPAKMVERRPVPPKVFQSKSWWYGTAAAAGRAEARRVREQRQQGYERKPKRLG